MTTSYGARWTRAITACQSVNGWSDERLATEMGMARPTLNRKKNGHAEWTAADMQRIVTLLGDTARVLAVDLDRTLLTGEYLTADAGAATTTGDAA